ncbi:putative short-chain dehydrogenase [Mycena olivaceomarginata]|nr:putative short-chain dehydrogenase [Mycena olivaceomarginata]
MEHKGTVVVTGANGGLGSAIVAKLASTATLAKPASTATIAGYYGVYTVRSPAAPAVRATLASAPLHDYDILPLDLTRLADVRAFAAALNARVAAGELPRIRALILNAAFQEYTTQTWTDDGAWTRTRGGSSFWGAYHTSAPSAPFNKMAFKDPKWRTFFPDGTGTEAIAKGTWSTTQDDPEWSGGLRRYAASKLCQIMMIPLRTAGKSAGDVVGAAFGEFGEERPDGWYFDGSKKAEMSAEARDEQKQEMLWRDTARYVRLEEGETILGDWK